MPPLLAAAQLKPDVIVRDDDDDDDEDEGETETFIVGGKRVSLHTSVLDEKATGERGSPSLLLARLTTRARLPHPTSAPGLCRPFHACSLQHDLLLCICLPACPGLTVPAFSLLCSLQHDLLLRRRAAGRLLPLCGAGGQLPLLLGVCQAGCSTAVLRQRYLPAQTPNPTHHPGIA